MPGNPVKFNAFADPARTGQALPSSGSLASLDESTARVLDALAGGKTTFETAAVTGLPVAAVDGAVAGQRSGLEKVAEDFRELVDLPVFVGHALARAAVLVRDSEGAEPWRVGGDEMRFRTVVCRRLGVGQV